MGDAEMAAKRGTTLADRTGAFMDAVIKKIDAGYDPAKFDAEKKARYEEAKYYEIALREREAVIAEASNLKGEIESTMTTSVNVAASMPVMGGNVLYFYEYYSRAEQNYGVGVVYGGVKKVKKQQEHVLWERKLRLIQGLPQSQFVSGFRHKI